MPATSEARIQANRRNAAKSTGPKTEEGKAASRGNAYKHGLTGSGVVASDEDLAAADRLSATLHEEMRPASALGSILVGRMAVLAVRMDRCGRQESAAIAERVRNAALDFDDRRADEADAWFGLLVGPESAGSDPGPLLRKLRRTPEGLARLIQGWVDLAAAIRRPDLSPWDDGHLRTFEALSGRRPTELYPSRASLLARVLVADDVSGLSPAEAAPLAGLDSQARAAWARERLVGLIADAAEDLEAAHQDLDHASIELDRAGAATRALFDASKEATLARKYEAAAERGFYRALGEFQVAEAEAASEPPANAPRGSLASFFPGAAAPTVRDQAGPPTPRPGFVERTEERPQSVGVPRPGAGPGGLR